MAVKRTYLDVLQDGKRRLSNNTPVNNFNPQGITKGFLDILALETEKIYDTLEYIYKAIDPTLAVGSDLDKIGFLLGESRSKSLVASDSTTTNFYFYIDLRLNWSVNTLITKNYSADERRILEENGYITVTNGTVTELKLPKDMIIGNSSQSITYTTVDQAVIGSSNEAYVSVVATGPGSDYNVQTNNLVYHSILEIPELRKIASFIKCTNRFPIMNGKYSQTDEEFRYAISTSRVSLRTNELAIRRAALSVPGVRDILFQKNKFGNGTVSIIVDGVSPLISTGLLNTIKERIQQEMSYGDNIFVDAPLYKGVTISFSIIPEVTTTDVNSLKSQARDQVIQYINDLPIGGEIVWNRVISLILDIPGITDVVPVLFKCGQYDPIYKINRKEIVLRYINQRANYNEKFYCDTGLCTVCA